MSGSTFGKIFKITTWGESHGRGVGVVVDGVPAGFPIVPDEIQKELNRRKPGQSRMSTSRAEKDSVEILSGIFNGKTTGTPISMLVWNQDADSSSYEYMKNTPRPGHADYPYQAKYGIRDYRGGGRSSARETVSRVAAGAIAKKLLLRYDVEIVAHVIELGGVRAKAMDFDEIVENLEKTPVRCADIDAADRMQAVVDAARKEGDSIGGVVEVIARGVPPGIGEPVFDKLDADIAKAMMSIGAVKGIEFGAGFECSRMKGSQMNDEIILQDENVFMKTNNAGGIIGGISTGMPIICKMAVKPTPSISKEQKTVDMESMKNTGISIKGRHDPTIPPRLVPVAESMMALVLVDHMMQNGSISSVSLLKK